MTIYTTPEKFEDLTPSPGQRIGKSFAEGIGSGLEALLKSKIERTQQQQKLKDFQSLFSASEGVPSEGAPLEERSEEITDQDVFAGGLIDPTLGKALQRRKESQEKGKEKEEELKAKEKKAKADRAWQRVKPIFARADERDELASQKSSALSTMEDAVSEGNIGFFSYDNLANLTGIEGLRRGKGAAFTAASKEYFLGSLKRAGARPNQWIEQQILKMLPMIGRSREANLSVLEMLKTDLAVEEEQSNILNRLAEEDEANFGYIKGDVGRRTQKELKKFADTEQRKLEIKLRSIQSNAKTQERITETEIIMTDLQGRRKAIDKKDVKKAREAGYKLVK